jgi:hypothetical protein
MEGAYMMMVLMEIDAGASFSQVSSSSPFNGVVVMVKILWQRLWRWWSGRALPWLHG